MIRKLVKSAMRRNSQAKYDKRHGREALHALEVIERSSGSRLPPSTKRQAYEYAHSVLGSRSYAPWLLVYSAVRGAFFEGWIPDNFYGWVVCPTVNKRIRWCAELKTFASIIVRDEALPDIGYVIDGHLYDRHMAILNDDEFARSVIAGQDEIFVKLDNSLQGKGVFAVPGDRLDLPALRRLQNCVLQAAISQHEFFDEIVSGSVATLRITTVKELDGTIDVRAAYLRVGRAHERHVSSASQVHIPVSLSCGTLGDYGLMPDWSRTDRHPDTRFVFSGTQLPGLKDAMKLCTGLHARCPHLTVVGWDIAVDKDERPRLLELNVDHNGIKFSEATSGPCFKGLGWERLRR